MRSAAQLTRARPGNSPHANSAAFAADIAACQASHRPLYIPAGTYRIDAPLTITGQVRVIGEGVASTTIQQTSPTANGVVVAPSSIAHGIVIEGLSVNGPGTGTGVGVNASTDTVKNGLTLRRVELASWGSHALTTAFTDYMLLEQLRVHNNNGDGWRAGTATNATTVIGCAFGVAAGFDATPGTAGIRLIDAEGATIVGSEFGRYPYGLRVEPGGSQDLHLSGSRFEACTVRHMHIGDGTTLPYPSGIVVSGVNFTGDSAVAPLVLVEGAQRVRFQNCNASQVASGGAFIAAGNTQAKLTVEDCVQNGGSFVFTPPSGAGTSDARIVYGGDSSSMVQPPYGATYHPHPLITESAEFMLGTVPRNMRVVGVDVHGGVSVPGSLSDYWTVTVSRYGSNGAELGEIAAVGGPSVPLPSFRRVPCVLGLQTTLLENEAFVVSCVKTGAPPALENFGVTVRFRPVG